MHFIVTVCHAFKEEHSLMICNFYSAEQLNILPANCSDVVVTGDDEGIFGIEAQFLYAIKPLDREKQPSYSLQVFILSYISYGIAWIAVNSAFFVIWIAVTNYLI